MQSSVSKYQLTAESCDRIAEAVEDFCRSAGTEKKDMLRYRLSIEECHTQASDGSL